MKKCIVISDSFKGSLSSGEICDIARACFAEVLSDCELAAIPGADGGEGTVDCFHQVCGGELVPVTVQGPFGQDMEAAYLRLDGGRAVIEMASSAGLPLVGDRRDPRITSTYGVGQQIRHAVEQGSTQILLGLGGSATNDGGIGMLKALGVRFLDENDVDAGEGGQALAKVSRIDISGLNPLLREAHIQVACDVNNPLCGEIGSTYVYGPQKGVTENQKKQLDEDMAHFAQITSQALGTDYCNTPGAGAAGGLGFAFLSYLGATLTPGIELILNAVGLEQELSDADVVVTGEGRLDFQTAMGKAPVGVAKLAKKYHAKVIAFAGSVTKEAVACNEAGIDAFFPIVRGISTLSEAMDPATAKANMAAAVEQVFRLL